MPRHARCVGATRPYGYPENTCSPAPAAGSQAWPTKTGSGTRATPKGPPTPPAVPPEGLAPAAGDLGREGDELGRRAAAAVRQRERVLVRDRDAVRVAVA